jgi:cob(I)alamin adenosyltransferase
MDKKKDKAPRAYRGPKKHIKRGLLIVYTGDGKGKTTAALGAVFRSLGRGLKVAIVQFMKGKWVSGEKKAFERFGSQVKIHAIGEGFTWETKSLQRDKKLAKKGWALCEKLLRENQYDVFLFDELNYELAYQFLDLKKVLKSLSKRHPHAHVLVTGRDAPSQLIEMADLVTEMRQIKHPFYSGITAQAGIDF